MAPQTALDAAIETPLPRMARVTFRALNAAQWGKIADADGLECWRAIAGVAPAKIEEPLHSDFAARNPIELTFDGAAPRYRGAT
jgi:hypothetical protein